MTLGRHNLVRWLTGIGLLAGLSLLAGGLSGGAARPGGSWIVQAVFSGPFLLAAGVAVLSVVLLGVIAVAMWRMAAARRSRVDGQGGTIMIEFALIFPIALMLVLLMVQSSLLLAGSLCVHYSAFCAARAAVTTVPLDYSPPEPSNFVDLANWGGSAKLRRVRLAAVYAVMPVSCGDEQAQDSSIALQDSLEEYFRGLGQQTPHWVRAMVGRKWQYADTHTDVMLDPPLNKVTYAPAEDLVVTVQHTFYLAVPYARRLFAVGNDGVTMSLSGGTDYGTKIRATCRLTNEGVQDYIDVEKWPG